MASASTNQASLLLQKQLKDLCKNPVDGFSAGLVDESNIFEWSVTIIGPPDTLYDGGFFNAIMSFPPNYPNSPPTVKFTSEVWHPNVYPDGRVCISILHPPGEDPNGYELASERWMPIHTVESIVLSVISMLSSPNDESPANIEAARYWKCTRGCKLCFQECWLQKQEAAYPCNVIDEAHFILFSIASLYFCVLEFLFLKFVLVFQMLSEACFYFSFVIDSLNYLPLFFLNCNG